MKRKAVVFGASERSKTLHSMLYDEYEVIAFVDNNPMKIGKQIDGIEIYEPNALRNMKYDEIILATMSVEDVRNQLREMEIEENCINCDYMKIPIKARIQFLKSFSKIVYEKSIKGEVAEAGVFRGEFAKEINELFPDRKLYLFDTFEGFDARDLQVEMNNNWSHAGAGDLNMTTEQVVLKKMKYPDMCEIKKGYFPETAKLVIDEFCYVNLDMDLYKPTLSGLEFFYDKLVTGGIITVHDYFSEDSHSEILRVMV